MRRLRPIFPQSNAAITLAVLLFASVTTRAWSQPVLDSLDVHWNEGAANCGGSVTEPVQIHNYEPQTYILRQNLCSNFERNFLYLLIGPDKAVLIVET